MRVYEKPVMEVELFSTDRTVAATSCNRVNTGSTTAYSYEPQTVYCIVSGSETIFNSGNSGCTNPVSVGESGSKWYFAGSYFVWYDGQSNGTPNAEQQKILSSCGINEPGWHAATYTVTESIQQLYGFSF